MEIQRLLLEMQEMLTDTKISPSIREAVIDLLLKNLMHMDGGLPRGWSWRFVEDRGTFFNSEFRATFLDFTFFAVFYCDPLFSSFEYVEQIFSFLFLLQQGLSSFVDLSVWLFQDF